jgi:hypothetical protein
LQILRRRRLAKKNPARTCCRSFAGPPIRLGMRSCKPSFLGDTSIIINARQNVKTQSRALI